jgi:molybdopterin-guanine dinucleotide biosynthesis protein A
MISIVVLAGGKSSRFPTATYGSEKGLVLLNSKPLVLWVIDALAQIATEFILTVSQKTRDKFINFFKNSTPRNVPIKIVEDTQPGLGPIGGMLTGFHNAQEPYVGVAPCDTPFIKPALYRMLIDTLQKSKNSHGVVCMVNRFYEPLHAVFVRTKIISALQKVVRAGKLKPTDAYQMLNLIIVNEPTISQVDANFVSFLNINTPQDLSRAKDILRRSVNPADILIRAPEF